MTCILKNVYYKSGSPVIINFRKLCSEGIFLFTPFQTSSIQEYILFQ